MATAPKEAENAIGLEEIHTKKEEPSTGRFELTELEIWLFM